MSVAALFVAPDGCYAGLPDVDAQPIVTRAQAKAAGLKRYVNGKPCPKGHLAERTVSRGACVECNRLLKKKSYDPAISSAHYAANKETIRAKQTARLQANPALKPAADKTYRAKNKERVAARKKQWKADNRDLHNEGRRKNLIRRRMTIAAFDAMFTAQGGRCAICRTDNGFPGGGDGRRLAIDHCHTTGLVRGLLCGNCNRVLGLMRDDPAALRRAADYLERGA